MALRAIIETVVHIEDFLNIDFYNQGLYYFRISIYHQKGEEKFYASPYRVIECPVNPSAEYKNYRLQAPYINEDLSAFCSHVFLVRYSEQEIPLSSYAIFRTEIDVEQGFESTQFHMDVELMFSDLKNLPYNAADVLSKGVQNYEIEFECASMLTYTLSGCVQGLY